MAMLATSGGKARVHTLSPNDVTARTGVVLPAAAHKVDARVTVRGTPWTAIRFRVPTDEVDATLAANHVPSLQEGVTVLRAGDDLGIRWRPLDATHLAGVIERLPDGRTRKVEVLWGVTPDPQICIVIH